MRIILALFVVVCLSPLQAKADVKQYVRDMLQDNRKVSPYKDGEVGRAVIAIGFGRHVQENIAIDIAKQASLKNLLAFIKGERMSALNRAEKKRSVNGKTEKSYYSSIRTSIDASMKAAYFYKSGKHKGKTYAVTIISERSSVATDLFNKKMASNIVKAMGVASLDLGRQKARQNALNQALRNAVEQYSGVDMAAKTSIENSTKYRAKLSSVSKGRVKKYDINKEFVDGRTYVVKITAEISTDEPDGGNIVAAVKENMGRPSFYMSVKDKRLHQMITEILTENDLDITNSKNRSNYLLSSNVDKHEFDMPAMKGMVGLQTTIKIRIVDRFSGEEFVNISNDPQDSMDASKFKEVRERNSYKYAMEKVRDKLIKQINQKFVKTFQTGAKVVVKLVRFDRMRDVDELRECIDSLPLTKSVSVLPLSKRTAVFEVIYLGSPKDLQLDILKKSREFRLRGLRAKASKGGAIEFKF